jgi:hypothetical protein
MTTRTVSIDCSEAIQGDHRHLKDTLERLHQQLFAAALTRAQTDQELRNLEAELEEHFVQEESGGFFAEILEFSPELDGRVHELLRQHQEFLGVLRSLRRARRWACGESGSRDGWLAEFARFHQRFNEHEVAENELQYVALQRDLGTGD